MISSLTLACYLIMQENASCEENLLPTSNDMQRRDNDDGQAHNL